MQGEEQKAYLPKLSIDGNNWVMYRDGLIWGMKQNTIKEHIATDTLPTTYIVKGKVGGLDPLERWERKELAICTALGNSMPDEAFSQIKDTELVKEAWDILKSTYQDHMAALVVDCMKVFWDIKCLEGGNV